MRFTWRHALVLALCLTPFFYAMGFAIPGGDDFSRAGHARYLFDLYEGLHEMLRAWWKWSGRYTHHFLVVFLGDLAESPFGYAMGCLGGALVYGIGMAGLFATLDKGRNWLVPALMGLLVVYGGFQGLYSAGYLLTDILGIWIGSGLLIWFIWGVCRLWLAERPERSHVWFPAITGALSIGCYEHSAVAVFLTALAVWWMARYCGHPHEKLFKKLVMIIGIAFALMFFARGNFRRQTKRGADLDLIIQQLMQAGDDWLQVVGWVFHSVYPWAALIMALSIVPKSRIDIRPVPTALWIIGTAFLIALMTMGITLVHAVSDVTVNRGDKLPANVSLLCGIMFCALLVQICAPIRTLAMGIMPRSMLAWILVLGLAAGVLWNSPNTLKTLSGITSGETAAVYAEARQRQEFVFSLSGKDADARVAPLSGMPYPLLGFRPTSDPAQWPSPQFAKLYGLKSIQAAWPELEPDELEAALAANPEYIPGIGQVTVGRDKDPLNMTFEQDWLVIKPEKPCDRIHVLLLPAPRRGRLLPQEVQRMLLGLPHSWADMLPASWRPLNLMEQRILQRSVQTRFMTYERVFICAPSQDAWAVPIHAVTSGPLLAVFISHDGVSFRRVRHTF